MAVAPTVAPAAVVTQSSPHSTPTNPPRATLTPIATRTPSPTATRGLDYPTVVLRWTGGQHIADVDDVSDIVTRLQAYPGIIGGYGDEIQITITYDPTKTNPDAIQRLLMDFGYQSARLPSN